MFQTTNQNLTCRCASRHNGVQLFISHLANWLCTRRFSEPTFDPPVFRDFPTFSRTCISSLLIFSHFLFFDFLFSDFLLCFASVYIVGCFTSKLPSIISNRHSYQIVFYY